MVQGAKRGGRLHRV
ncbi:hypothetical protein NGA_0603200, partial [Nannochloropsis gaditana CCMP526]